MDYLEILFVHLCRLDVEAAADGRLRSGDRLPTDEIYRFLCQNLYAHLTLDDICGHFHFGKTHISVGFKKKFGVSVFDCYLDLKIEEAKRLLREENITVREISERLCFDSPEYFSRCFKKRAGYTPRVYRGMLIREKIEKKLLRSRERVIRFINAMRINRKKMLNNRSHGLKIDPAWYIMVV